MLNFAKVIVEEDNQSQYGVLSLSTLQSGDPLMDFYFLLAKFVKCVFALGTYIPLSIIPCLVAFIFLVIGELSFCFVTMLVNLIATRNYSQTKLNIL